MTAKAKLIIEGQNATAAAWRSVMGDAQSASKKMSGLFRSAFAGISVGAIVNLGRNAIKLGDDLNKAAIKAGVSGRAMSELAYVAKQSDIELEALSSSIKKMQVNLSEAASGSKAQVASLKAIGVELKDIKGLGADKQFELIAEKISRIKDPADRTRAAVEIFGKAGADLLPMFEQGAEGVRKLREEAVALGVSLSDDAIRKLAQADDAVKKLESSWKSFAATLTAKVAPALTNALNFWANAPRTLSQQIADLEDELDDVVGTRGTSAETQRAALKKRLDQLRGMAKQESMREMGVGGTGGEKPPPGFVDQDAIDRAKKTRDALATEAEKTAAALREIDRGLNEDLDKGRDEKMDKFFEDEERKDQYIKDRAALMKEIQIQQQNEISETAQVFRDGFINAFDDMVNTGKFKWKELLKYMIAEFARMQIIKLFDGMLKGGNGGGIGGFFSGVMNGLKGAFGGTRDSGGRGSAGNVYAIGRGAQPELFVPDSAGTFIPRGAGGHTFAPVYNIDARGADIGLVQRLPAILKQASEATESRMIERLKRNHYGLG